MNKEASSGAVNKEGEGDAERIQLCCRLRALPVGGVTSGRRPRLVFAGAFPIPGLFFLFYSPRAGRIWAVQRSCSISGLSVVIKAKIIPFGHFSSGS